MTGRTFEKVTIYSEAGADRSYALRALAASAPHPDSNLIGYSYGSPAHTHVTLKRNKAGVTVWVYAS